jgi:lipoprotein-anchoring transpeptidase ErfK/SrfK
MTVGRGRVFTLVVFCALLASAPANAQVPPDPEPVIAAGVTVAGVDVGGLTAAEARAAVQAFFARPLNLRLGTERTSVRPTRFGARARIPLAISAALSAPADRALRLRVVVSGPALRAWVARKARVFHRKPVNARIILRGSKPRIVAARLGRKLVKPEARTRIRAALLAHRRALRLQVRSIRPAITPRKVGPAIVVRRGSRRLVLYRGSKPGKMRAVRTFPVAVGQPAWPTPLGSFAIRTMTRNPWWYPPDQPWAEGAQPIPPGPGNPLGTRWMGVGGGVGIHGTYNSGSVGTAASHGCIRMHISSSEWLFERVRIGTPVYIIGS